MTVLSQKLCLLWARHEKSPEVYERVGTVTMRRRTMLVLNIIPVSHIQTHFKSSTCCVFVHVLVTDKDNIDAEVDNGSDTENV